MLEDKISLSAVNLLMLTRLTSQPGRRPGDDAKWKNPIIDNRDGEIQHSTNITINTGTEEDNQCKYF